jgi:predicted ArsR family transcriptional regulator
MILSELISYIRERRQVSLDEIGLRFGIEQEAARNMLELLSRKGRIREVPEAAACSKQCSFCNCNIYQSCLWEVVSLNGTKH